jgi:hypothetical protein
MTRSARRSACTIHIDGQPTRSCITPAVAGALGTRQIGFHSSSTRTARLRAYRAPSLEVREEEIESTMSWAVTIELA